jgi:acetolactate synthase-1/2/3 large subunit
MKRVSEQISDWLVRQGIEKVFTVTGGGAMFLNQALGGNKNLDCTFMHHEQACAMAAEGYARVAGKPAVVMLTTGPGSINSLNGVYGAFTDSIPMIIISGQVKRETCLDFHDLPGLRQLGDQESPTIAMASPVCKFAKLIRTEQDLVTALPEAFSLACFGRPGPVWLDIPLDIQSSTIQIEIPDIIKPAPIYQSDLVTQCENIVKRLANANRPLILAGTGVRLSGAAQQLIRFAEKTGIPIATAWTHDLIPSDHPLFAGRPGTIGTRAGNFCLQGSDIVIVLGSRLNIRQTSYNWESFAPNAWIVHVDIDAAELNKPTIKVDQPILSDVHKFIEVLEECVENNKLPNYSDWSSWCKEIGREYAVNKEHKQESNSPLNPYIVVDKIFNGMRDDDIVVCGNASACILPFQIGTIKKNQRLFSNSGSASMGYDLPAAIGAACASNRRVICFAGDGSLQMNIQELQTLKTIKANVIIVILNNSGYLSIWQTHENFFGKVIGATPESGVEFPDFKAVGTAYGIPSYTLENIQDLDLLDALLLKNGPIILNIKVDTRQEFVPRIKSRVNENGKFITPELDDMHPFLEKTIVQKIRESAKAIRNK